MVSLQYKGRIIRRNYRCAASATSCRIRPRGLFRLCSAAGFSWNPAWLPRLRPKTSPSPRNHRRPHTRALHQATSASRAPAIYPACLSPAGYRGHRLGRSHAEGRAASGHHQDAQLGRPPSRAPAHAAVVSGRTGPDFNLMAPIPARGHIFHWLFESVVPLLASRKRGARPGLGADRQRPAQRHPEDNAGLP